MPTVWIPSLMQKLTEGVGQVTIDGRTVREVIDNMDARFPGFKDRVCAEGEIKPNCAVAIDGEISPEGLRRKVAPESEVHFLPAMAGG